MNQGVQAAREERYIVRGEIVVRELVIVTQFVQDMLLYQELNPTVRFVVQGYSAQSLDDEDTCDFLICTNLDNIRMNRKSKCWSEVQLANGQMCIAVSRESKWYTDAISKEGAAYMSDFKDALFSMVAKRNRYESDVTIKLCQEAGFYPQIYSRADDYAFRMGQVDRGLAISVVTNDHIPELERNYKNICVVPLKDAGAQFKIYLLHPQESMLSEAALDFLELLKENHEELC